MEKEVFVSPTATEMTALIGEEPYALWGALCRFIEERYDIVPQWNPGGKAWKYEYKYRKGGKTLCALYARENCWGLMIIFGKEEREKVESQRAHLLPDTLRQYDEAATYHDGKWVMFQWTDAQQFVDVEILLSVKRKAKIHIVG